MIQLSVRRILVACMLAFAVSARGGSAQRGGGGCCFNLPMHVLDPHAHAVLCGPAPLM